MICRSVLGGVCLAAVAAAAHSSMYTPVVASICRVTEQ